MAAAAPVEAVVEEEVAAGTAGAEVAVVTEATEVDEAGIEVDVADSVLTEADEAAEGVVP